MHEKSVEFFKKLEKVEASAHNLIEFTEFYDFCMLQKS